MRTKRCSRPGGVHRGRHCTAQLLRAPPPLPQINVGRRWISRGLGLRNKRCFLQRRPFPPSTLKSGVWGIGGLSLTARGTLLHTGHTTRSSSTVYFANTGKKFLIFQPCYIDLETWGYLGGRCRFCRLHDASGREGRLVQNKLAYWRYRGANIGVACPRAPRSRGSSRSHRSRLVGCCPYCWSPLIPCAAPDAWTLNAELWLRPGLADGSC